jgi:hypothetical protein
VLFAGFWLHELNQGHLAPLALFTRQPLIARSQVHDHWNYKELIPYEYLVRGDQGIDQYLDLFNVSAVVTHRLSGPEFRGRQWRTYYLGRPEQFRELWSNREFSIFERRSYQSNWTEQGSVRAVVQNESGLSFTAESAEIVLRFRYQPFLQSTACQLSEAQFPGEVSLIRLTHCSPGQSVQIKMLPLPLRLLQTFFPGRENAA